MGTTDENRRWYLAHREEQIARAKKNRLKIRNMIRERRKAPCMDCGETYPPYVMEFDHREPAKMLFRIGGRRIRPRSKEGLTPGYRQVEAEIAKCDLVCANCHKIRTHNRRVAQADRAPVS